MNKYYEGMIEDVINNYDIDKNSSLEELIITFKYFQQENEKLKEENLKLAEENIDLRTYIYVEKASFKPDGKNFYEIMETPTYEELQEKNQKLKEKNTIYKSTIKGQYNKIKELQNSKRISKEVHKKRNKKLQEENQKLKEDIKHLVNIINNNCLESTTTEEEFESLKRWNK